MVEGEHTAVPEELQRAARMPEPGSEESAMLEVVRNVGQLAADSGRADLARRIEQTQARLVDPDIRVIVVGEFKQGKSKLINALVNAPACPVDDDVATSVPTSVGYADEPSAWVLEQRD
ncbi:MAG: dynamin family protein, partial [Agromyces sp.]